jgi:hypothetical protein
LDHSLQSPFTRGYSFGAIGNFGQAVGGFGWRLDGFIGRRRGRDCWVEEQRGRQGVFGKRVEQKGAYILQPTHSSYCEKCLAIKIMLFKILMIRKIYMRECYLVNISIMALNIKSH